MREREIRQRVGELLELVQLDWAASRYPHQLSGGQRQRIALARALAIEPNVLLLDEPFGALDAKVRKELRRWLRHLHDTMGLTSVFVTHDQEEAMEIADRIVVMNHGRIVQTGTPEEIYTNPSDAFIFHFLGNANTIEGIVTGGTFRLQNYDLTLSTETSIPDGPCLLYVRPHDVYIRLHQERSSIRGKVNKIYFLGPTTRIELLLSDGRTLDAEINSTTFQTLNLQQDQDVFIEPRNARFFVPR